MTHWEALAGYLESGGLRPQLQTHRTHSGHPSATRFGAANPHAAIPDAIKIDSLNVRRGDRLVLEGISLQVRRGSVTGLLGPSGCGKSTLIRAIMGVQSIESGTVTVLGEPAEAPALRSKVGYVTQAPALYSDLTVRQNLRYFARILAAASDKVDEVLDTVDLGHVQNQLAANLSGGQRARVSLATALLGEPDLLVSMNQQSGSTRSCAEGCGTPSQNSPGKAPRCWSPVTSWTRPPDVTTFCSVTVTCSRPGRPTHSGLGPASTTSRQRSCVSPRRRHEPPGHSLNLPASGAATAQRPPNAGTTARRSLCPDHPDPIRLRRGFDLRPDRGPTTRHLPSHLDVLGDVDRHAARTHQRNPGTVAHHAGRKLDILLGYAAAFAAVAVIQVGLVASVAFGLLGLEIDEPTWQMLLLGIANAVLGMALGLFVSAFAR